MIELAQKIISRTLQATLYALSAEELEAGIVGFMLEDLPSCDENDQLESLAARILAAIWFEPNREQILNDVLESEYDEAAVLKNGQTLVDNVVLLLEKIQ